MEYTYKGKRKGKRWKMLLWCSGLAVADDDYDGSDEWGVPRGGISTIDIYGKSLHSCACKYFR